MKRKILHIPFFFLLLVLISYSFVSPKKSTETQVIKSLDSVQKKNPSIEINPDYGNIPLYFIPNEGQVNEKALFYAKTSRYTLWMTREGLVFDSSKKLKRNVKGPKSKAELDSWAMPRKDIQPEKYERDVSRLIFQNANENPEIVSLELTEHQVNYFIGKNKSKWKTDISTSKNVLYKDLYKNIDLKVYGMEKQIEYDWIVKPGGNPEEIVFTYKDTNETEINKKGDLLVQTEFGELVHKKPVSFQIIGGDRVDVESSFKHSGKDTYGFEVGSYNKNYELIIDPVVLTYSTYLGGGDGEYGYGIAVDSSGNAYVTGFTNSTDFPTLNHYQTDQGSDDVIVMKLSSAGNSLIYSTYLGGGSYDYGRGIAVDSSGNAYITGYTYSTDFPTLNPYQIDQGSADAFVTKLSPSGDSLIYSTYLSGSEAEGGYGIALDSSGNAYVAGYTNSTNFPTKNPYQTDQSNWDVFVTKLSSAGSSLIYSTYLGGDSIDYGYSIAVDSSGNAYVTGYTSSTDFPTLNHYQTDQGSGDVFVTKLSPSGDSLAYSTYLGGGAGDYGYGIAVDSSGNAYVTGLTVSTDFPTLNHYQTNQNSDDVFVTKLSSAGSSLIYSTYLGGGGGDYGYGIAVDSSGNAYVTGLTESTDFPTLNHYQANQGIEDVFVTKLSSAGSSLTYSTYLGGGGGDYGYGIAVDSSGNAYVTGYTFSTDFPTQNPYQTDQGSYDAFITKLSISTGTGTLAGKVTDATNNNPIVGATVSIAGLSDTTDNNGDYEITDIPIGALTADFTASPRDGDVPLSVTFSDLSSESSRTVTCTANNFINFQNDSVSITEGDTTQLNIAMSPEITEGEMRLVLTWGENPSDLDSHLKTPEINGTNYHIYFFSEGSEATPPYATLDVDDTDSYGPETITIYQRHSGDYRYFIHDYTNIYGTGQISTSGAEVKIYSGEGLVETIKPPTSGGGTYWEVCKINGQTGQITVINLITDSEPAGLEGIIAEALAVAKKSKKSTIQSATSWSWDFGDGDTSSLQNPTHIYQSAGSYDVKLTVTGDQGSDTETKVNYITVNPIVDISITVTSPNGGENWQKGSTHNITWTQTGLSGNVTIDLYKGGSLDSNISTVPASDGSYSWDIPSDQAIDNEYKIRIYQGSVEDYSNANFSIKDVESITVTSPNGGESWQKGSTHNITWTQTGLSGNVTIDLYKDSSLNSNIGTALASEGSYSWDIPSDQAIDNDYKVRIYQGSVEDYSNANFSIIDAESITITSPNGGESWQNSRTHNITWTQTGLSGNVTIDLYKGSSLDSNIGTASVSDGSYSWDIPSDQVTGEDYKVRIHQDSIEDYSNANFSITEYAQESLIVGNLTFYAGTVDQSESVYTLSGEVNINGKLWFSSDVTYTSDSSTTGIIACDGYPFVKLSSGNQQLFTSTSIIYNVNGAANTLEPSGLDLVSYSLSLTGIPLGVTSNPITLKSDGVLIGGNIKIGSAGFTLCSVDVDVLYKDMDKAYLQDANLDVSIPSTIPGINVTSIGLSYNSAQNELTGSAVLDFPFLGLSSIEASLSVQPGCVDGFRIAVGLTSSIPLGTTGLKIAGFTLEVDNICNPPNFFIFIGGDLGIVGVPTEVFILDDAGLGYQHPFRLNIIGGDAKLLDYPIASLSGYIDTSKDPAKTGVGFSGVVDFGGVYIAEINLKLLVKLPRFSGSAKGVLRIPDFPCSWTDYKCRVIKTLIKKIIPLPYPLSNQPMDVEIGKEDGVWVGSLKGRVSLGMLSFAAALDYENYDLHFSIGRDYESLIQILRREEIITLSGSVEQVLTFPSVWENVIFAAIGSTTQPQIYLRTPLGDEITSGNVDDFSGINFAENSSDLVTLFAVDKVFAGTWTFGVSNLSSSEVSIEILSPRPLPQTSFTQVDQSGNTVDIGASISSAESDTKVSFFYSDKASGGTGSPIVEDIPASSGSVLTSWDTTSIQDGSYYIFSRTFDDSDILVVTYYGSPVVISNNGIEPPSDLQGTKNGNTVNLTWTESTSLSVIGYKVLYTDEPEIAGYKFQKGANEKDRIEIGDLDPLKNYRFCVVAFDSTGNFSSDSNTYTTSGSSDSDVWVLSDGVSASDNVTPGAWKYYKIEVPNSSEKLTVETSNSTENVDLYVRKNENPDLVQYDFQATTSSGDESISIDSNNTNPQLSAGEWYIGVYGIESTSFSINASISYSAGIPEIELNRNTLRFGTVIDGSSTSPQKIVISNKGTGQINWKLSNNYNWLRFSQTRGTGVSAVIVSVDASGYSEGIYTDTIIITDQNASNSPQTLTVTLTVKELSDCANPFGSYDTPIDGTSGITGAIPVTGWVLDDIGIESVKVYRDPVEEEDTEDLIYIGDALFVEGARPDVEQAYPDYPQCNKAGWGYMMLTNFLPGQGNGTYKIHAYATDLDGHTVSLGTKTIHCDNANAVKPFGAIDTPTQGGTVTGSFWNSGWALTPMPNSIPTDGSTIFVWVDGVRLGNPDYNQRRQDIVDLFPGYENTNGAVGAYYLDTTTYTNGVHTIAWSVADDAGNSDGIGSRFFTISNIGGSAQVEIQNPSLESSVSFESVMNMPANFEPIEYRRGYQDDIRPVAVNPDPYGVYQLEVKEVERVEIEIGEGVTLGYMAVGDQLRPLPIGSSLDMGKGIFYWQPGPGFIGEYDLVFIKIDEFGMQKKMDVKIKIRPKFRF